MVSYEDAKNNFYISSKYNAPKDNIILIAKINFPKGEYRAYRYYYDKYTSINSGLENLSEIANHIVYNALMGEIEVRVTM